VFAVFINSILGGSNLGKKIEKNRFEQTMNTLQIETDKLREERADFEGAMLAKRFEERRELLKEAPKPQPEANPHAKRVAEKQVELFHEAGHVARVLPIGEQRFDAFVDGHRDKPGVPNKQTANQKAEKIRLTGQRVRVIDSQKGYRVLEGGMREKGKGKGRGKK
jgi:hypothetical protein